MCVARLEEKRAELERRGMSLSHIRSVGEPLRLGQLQGNHFDLVVRDLRPHRRCSGTGGHARLAALIKEAVENVEVVFLKRKNSFFFFRLALHQAVNRGLNTV